MFNETFYFSTLKNYVSLFGTLFSEINVQRTSASSNSVTQFVRVPITYASKEKMLARVREDPDIDRPTATLPLPMMSFDVVSFQYDGGRKLESATRRTAIDTSDPNSLKYQFTPVPWNIGFELYVYAKNEIDGNKIIEQIIPYFTPDYTSSVVLVPELGFTTKIPIVLASMSHEDSSTGPLPDHQAITWTLGFVLKGYFLGPVKTGKIVKFIESRYYAEGYGQTEVQAEANSELAFSVTVQPGQMANGAPTSNASLSVDSNTILVNSDFGYVVTVNSSSVA
jgi:hypothetical protein